MQDVNDAGPDWSEKEKIRYTAALLPGEKKGIKIHILIINININGNGIKNV